MGPFYFGLSDQDSNTFHETDPDPGNKYLAKIMDNSQKTDQNHNHIIFEEKKNHTFVQRT